MAVTNLKQAMALFNITETALAQQLHIDRGSINRWKTGERPFGPDSPYPRQIAEFLLNRPQSAMRDTLISLAAPGYPAAGLDQTTDALIAEVEDWLRHAVGAPQPSIPEALHGLYTRIPAQPTWPDRDADMPRAPIGYCDLGTLFRHLLFAMRDGQKELLLHVCVDDGVRPAGDAFARFWAHFTGTGDPAVRVVFAQGHKQGELNELLSQWVPLLSKARIALLSVPDRFAVRQTTFALEGEDCVYCLTQPTADDEPLCLVLREGRAQLIQRDLQAALARAKPLLRMLTDEHLPELELAFWGEFAERGAYDIFKSGVNTMYMTPEDFRGLLIRKGYPSEVCERKSVRFRLFQDAMRSRMEKDAARELLSRAAVEEMVATGRCVLPGVYFELPGLMELDAEAIAAVCRGYAEFLRAYPKMDVRLSTDTPQFLNRLCWHIKHGQHALVQTWDGDTARSVLTENAALTGEFRRSFQAAWKREHLPHRESLIQSFESWANQAILNHPLSHP